MGNIGATPATATLAPDNGPEVNDTLSAVSELNLFLREQIADYARQRLPAVQRTIQAAVLSLHGQQHDRDTSAFEAEQNEVPLPRLLLAKAKLLAATEDWLTISDASDSNDPLTSAERQSLEAFSSAAYRWFQALDQPVDQPTSSQLENCERWFYRLWIQTPTGEPPAFGFDLIWRTLCIASDDDFARSLGQRLRRYRFSSEPNRQVDVTGKPLGTEFIIEERRNLRLTALCLVPSVATKVSFGFAESFTDVLTDLVAFRSTPVAAYEFVRKVWLTPVSTSTVALTAESITAELEAAIDQLSSPDEAEFYAAFDLITNIVCAGESEATRDELRIELFRHALRRVDQVLRQESTFQGLWSRLISSDDPQRGLIHIATLYARKLKPGRFASLSEAASSAHDSSDPLRQYDPRFRLLVKLCSLAPGDPPTLNRLLWILKPVLLEQRLVVAPAQIWQRIWSTYTPAVTALPAESVASQLDPHVTSPAAASTPTQAPRDPGRAATAETTRIEISAPETHSASLRARYRKFVVVILLLLAVAALLYVFRRSIADWFTSDAMTRSDRSTSELSTIAMSSLIKGETS